MKKGFFAPVILLAITITLFGACASEEENVGGGSDEKVTVHFTVSEQPFGATETVTSRGTSSSSSSSEEKVVEEKLIPVGGNLYARTKLVENTSTATRATEALGNNRTLRIFAYATGTTTNPVWTGDFKMSGGQLTRTSSTPATLTAGSYDFIAISYNDESVPSDWDLQEIPVEDVDLLWCKKTQAVSEHAADISLTLMHLFSEVSVTFSTTKLDAASQSVKAIADVSIRSSKGAKFLDVTDTTATSFMAVDEPYEEFDVSFPALASPFPASVTSAPVRVFQKYDEAPFSFLEVGSVTVGSTVFEDGLSLSFNKKMLPGHSYNLFVDFTYLYFADSNIFWDPTLNNNSGNLTFYGYGEASTNSEKRYQGIFFKWGSLVGISPAITPGLGNDQLFYGDNTPVYVQTTASSGVWESKVASAVPAFNISTGQTADAYEAILYTNASYTSDNYDRYSTYFFTAAGSDRYATYTFGGDAYRGDICYALTKDKTEKYRIPTSIEFDALRVSMFMANKVGPWSEDYASSNSYGTTSLESYCQAGNVILPASGMRGGSLNMVNAGGYYWSSTGSESDHAYLLPLNEYAQYNTASGGSLALPVRCVTDKAPASIRITGFNKQENSVSAGVTN